MNVSIPVVDVSWNRISSGDRVITVPPRLAELMTLLIAHYPRPANIERLSAQLYGSSAADMNAPTKTIHVFVAHLRLALPAIGWTVKNQRGAGYYLEPIAVSPAPATRGNATTGEIVERIAAKREQGPVTDVN
jgi:DNA-binding response OmpR family regulator